ncbi:MAG TPA: H4MPT-linked C1 transfer pathway protein [Methanocorpusculum sp.]|nr:H4MPT-linked C1 transfer pathway protein [Methanocorpusculum sp.]
MIGIDAGGANLKIASESGVEIHYCPLWKESSLADIISQYSNEDNAFVVMSGELSDGFYNKREGIKYIAEAVKKTFPDALFYGTDAKFHKDTCMELAAANWLASVDFLRRRYPNALLADIGSTTADIIPLSKFDELLGMTDILRLQKGYLVYTGMLRTPAAVLADSCIINGVETPFSSEYFACSGDAHFVMGNISRDDYTSATPDGRDVSYDACLRRLSRTVCADLEEIGEKEAVSIAEKICNSQKDLIKKAVEKVLYESGSDRIITAGIGSKYYAEVLGGVDLTEETKIPADALPAYAVLKLGLLL